MKVKEYVEKYKDEMIKDLAKLVSYNSVLDESSDYPFGEQNARCLEAGLALAEKVGMKTTNLDYYAGFGEIGEGEKLIGVIGHLDVVPAGKGWESDPFTLVERDGKLYGRGTSDDKGAVVASAYAIKILQDMQIPLTKRIRLIMGSNEETGSKCLAHYVEKEGHVDYGFTPDANFPGVFGEKGMVGASFSGKTQNIISIEGGLASNVVCGEVCALIKKDCVNLNHVGAFLTSYNMEYEIEDTNEGTKICVHGISAHASTPNLGRNAISYLMVALSEGGIQDDFVEGYVSLLGLDNDGYKCGVKFSDEYGSLTLNNGVIKQEKDVITGSIDIRFPVTMKSKDVVEALTKGFEGSTLTLLIRGTHEPLFFDLDSDLVKSLVSAYQEVTGDYETQPMTMGGGTYAKGINNTIAFGCEFLGVDAHIHDANEFVPIEDLMKQVEIYVQALINLLEL